MSESADRLAEALWRNGCRGYNVTTAWDDLSPDVRDYWRGRAQSVDRAGGGLGEKSREVVGEPLGEDDAAAFARKLGL